MKLAHLYSAKSDCLIIFLYLVKLAHMYPVKNHGNKVNNGFVLYLPSYSNLLELNVRAVAVILDP